MDSGLTTLTDIVGKLTYIGLAVAALWGAFHVIVLWRRVAQIRFRSEDAQNKFLDQIDEQLAVGDLEGAADLCEADSRAVPQLILLAINNRDLGYAKLRHFVAERFQRDVLADLEYRLVWIATVIKTAPMLGLFGTVVGMMGAFAKLASSQKVEASNLANDISVALITTFDGLAIAIPLIICVASVNVRMRKMEDLVGAGLTRFFDSLKPVLEKSWQETA